MRILDLCCGRKGVTNLLRKRGYEVVSVDINPKFNPDIVADINDLHLESPGDYDLVWASPVCTEYTKMSLPASWKCNGGKHTLPDMSLFLNCYRIIRYLKPRYWVIENVGGAIPYFALVLGKPSKRIGSRVLWGEFPLFDTSAKYGKWKLSPTPDRAELRSEIPEGISKALCMAIEQEMRI
ncbi:MAG: hypothetical protein WC455_28150 [Dehalococcoidia bacterium]|jgi:SAM-dependent methyltransferase